MQWVAAAVGSLFAIILHLADMRRERRLREVEERLARLEARAPIQYAG